MSTTTRTASPVPSKSVERVRRTAVFERRGLAEAQTLAATALMFVQIFYLLMCRTLKEPIGSIGLFSNRYIFIGTGAVAAAAGFMVVPVIVLEKTVRRRPGHRRWPRDG
ncbi:MAG: ATPase, P-type, family [Aeromicrobium sp.]|jgi:magnesium-transporting ATPase (P-type)|nr:ATPase, P-type, family [Aeromicrobium sp.]